MIKKGSRYRTLNDSPWVYEVRGCEVVILKDEKDGRVLCQLLIGNRKPFSYSIEDFERGYFIPDESGRVKSIMEKYDQER